MATPSRGVDGDRGEVAGVTVTPIRLACCITELNPGGAERMFVELICRLDRDRWEPTVISLGSEGEPLVERLRSAGVEVRCLEVKRWWNVSVVSRLARELRGLSADALQTWLFHANVAGCLAAGRVGIEPVLTGIRVAERRGRWRLWAERFCTRGAHRHVCVSDDVARFSRECAGLDAGKLEVIANGVDLDRFVGVEPLDLSSRGVSARAPVLAWIGRLDAQKDPLAAIEAIARLEGTQRNCQLVLAGEGPLRGRVETRIGQLGLSDRVHLLGRVSEIPSLLARSCGLILTSRWEGMPNVVLEAMAAGRPVVVRVVEGVSALVEDGRTGWLVGDDRVSSLSDAITQLLADVSRAELMGLRGRQKVTEEFPIERMVSRYEALWEREISLARG